MAWVAVAGLAVTAVGAGVSAYGAKKNADAIGDANHANAANEEALFSRQSDSLDSLIKRKNKKLHNIGNIFDRFESTGAFGDTDTLKNLRKAQNDFSQLAAGNFTEFEAQLRKSMGDALVNTVGSGSPVGSYAQLAADTQMQYRQQGIQTSVGISEYLSNEASKLLGAEFGIMDQKFNSKYEMDRTRVTNTNNYALGEASTVGQGMVAMGNAGMQIGSAITSAGLGYGTYKNQVDQLKVAQTQADSMLLNSKRAAVPNYTPPAYNGPAVNMPVAPSGGWGADPGLPQAAPTWQAPQSDGLLSVDPGWYHMYPNSPYKYTGQQLNDYSAGVLPPLTSNSILSSVGASIVRA